MIPSLERQFRSSAKIEPRPTVIVDLSNTHRLETSVVKYLQRQGREIASQSCSTPMLLAGVTQGTGVHADLQRGGITCDWKDHCPSDELSQGSKELDMGSGTPTFDTLSDAAFWTKTWNKGEKGPHRLADIFQKGMKTDHFHSPRSHLRPKHREHILQSSRSRLIRAPSLNPASSDPSTVATAAYARRTYQQASSRRGSYAQR